MQTPPFAAMVRSRMRERGLGLRELCRAADVDPSYLSKVLADKRSPPWEEALLRRLARVLELDAAHLIAAAGRIPSEWGAIWRDEDLFAAVHGLASGRAGAPPRPRPPQAGLRRPVPPKEFGDELL